MIKSLLITIVFFVFWLNSQNSL